MRVPDTHMLTCDELKQEYPDAIRYLAPWGEKNALLEAEAEAEKKRAEDAEILE